MLEYLYDLFEGEERQALETHLTGCPVCQAELVKAKGQRQLLATAAKMAFPDMRFTAPAADTTTAPPAVPPAAQPGVILLQRPRRPLRWRRWAVAASVLLALGAAVPAIWYGRDYVRTEQIVALGKERFNQAKTEKTEAETRLARLPIEKEEKKAATHEARRAAQLQVKVQGPASLRAGAPNDYLIFTSDLNNRPVPATVSVEVMDRGQTIGKPLAAPVKVSRRVMDRGQTIDESRVVTEVAPGIQRVTLPSDLPIRPGSQPALVVSAHRDNGSQVDLREEMQLAAPVYVTHLEIDKPMYQPGETVHFRSLTLDRFSLKPAEQELHLQYVLTIPGGQQRVLTQGKSAMYAEGTNAGKELLGPDQKPLRGLGASSFPIEETWDGGEYALTVRELNQRFPEQRRKFLVNKYAKPRLNKELDFSRKSYGPGDEVVARCKAKYLDGRPVMNCQAHVTVTIDGRQYGKQGEDSREAFPFQTDDNGVVNVRFRLPKDIARGLGTVSVRFDAPAMPDTIVRPIPIVLKKLHIEFCPEGGDLVAGLSNRVYFEVRSTLDKPADLQGELLEDGKPLGVKVETLSSEKTPELNQGMGRFEFTPRAGRKYTLKIETPVGVTERHELPAVKADGVVLSIPRGVVKAGEDIPVTVRSKSKHSLMVGAYCRGRLLDSTELNRIHFVGDEALAVLKPASGAGGVCRVTVFEVQRGDGARRALIPIAERLIYREPAERVQLALKPDQKTYVPRQTVKLGIEAKTEKGEPAPAVVLLRVVDKSVVTLADDKTLRAMPTHFLLTTEVRRPEDLEYADFLLGQHPQAAEALDLLLGTQGWRRFAEQDPNHFRQHQKEEAERLLVTIGQSQPQVTDLTEQDLARVEKEYALRIDETKAQVARAGKAEEEARQDTEYRAAVVKLEAYDDFIDRARLVGAPVLGALLVLVAIACLILGLFRKLVRALPYYAAMAACAAAVVLLLKLSWGVAPQAPRADDLQVAEVKPPADKSIPKAEEPEIMATEAHDNFQLRLGKEKLKAERKEFEAVPPPAVPRRNVAPEAAAMPGMVPDMTKADKGGLAGHALQGGGAGAGKDLDKRKQNRGVAVPGNGVVLPQAHGAELEQQFRNLRDDRAADKKPGVALDLKAGARKPVPMGGAPGPAPQAAGLARQLRLGGQEKARRRAEQFGFAWQAMPVREYRHPRAGGPPELRSDFAETLYWHPALVLNGGKAEVSFDLCDSLGAFEVTAFVHTLDGRLGSATQTIASRLPFTVQPRTPLEVTAGDKIDIALAVANNTSEARTAHVSVTEHANLSLADGSPAADVSVPADSSIRKLYRFRPTVQEGTATLRFTGKTDSYPADSVRTTFRVVPEGFPVVGAHSDLLEKSATTDMELPQTWIKDTLKCQVQVYPSTLADLQKGLESLLREPCGCFEQTSTSNYPNLLILKYLKESDQTKPAVERRARELLDRGYQKLTSFECMNPAKKAKEGYEWFGGTAPAHEALTAYGLMEFRDMAAVHEVDPAMLKRTQQYLLNQRDGKGSFKRNPRALDTFGRAPEHITNAYIVWALTESGKDDDITKELTALGEQAKTSKDPYFLSLIANSLINRAKTADATKLLKKVTELQKPDGHLDAEQTSITGSGGRDLQIETTALAVLGWLKANPGEFNGNVQKAIRWIGQQRGGYGGFGSTQSTILALKALIQYTKANKKTPEAGELRLFVGERKVDEQHFAAGATEPLTLSVPDAETTLKPGKNAVRVEITGQNAFPYTLTWSYQTRQPASADKCPVKLSAKLDRAEVNEGETVHLNVQVENASGKGQGMTAAILGLPGGLTIPEDMKQLKDYTRQPKDDQRPLVSYFEVRGRELVLYWRDLAPDQKIEVPIDLICRVPGEYSGPASRAYLYYNADLKHWVEPLKVSIAAKTE
jgi:hypothetical protein